MLQMMSFLIANSEVSMTETRMVETAVGMASDVSVGGRQDAHAPLVLMLHGFGVSRFFWNTQVEAVAEAGFFAVAPNQRGYAAGARPDPADRANYRVDRLLADTGLSVDRHCAIP